MQRVRRSEQCLKKNLEEYIVYTLGYSDALEIGRGELKRLLLESKYCKEKEENKDLPKLPITLSDNVVSELDALEKETGYSKSKIVDLACRLSLPQVRKHLTQYKASEAVASEP